MQSYIPSLLILDGFGVEARRNGDEHTLSDCSSSLISSSLHDIDNSVLSDRNAPAEMSERIRLNVERCPSRQSSRGSASREPIVGNFVATARTRRELSGSNRSPSASTLSSLSAGCSNRKDRFPPVLPQSEIDLEIGVSATGAIARLPMKSLRTDEAIRTENTFGLLEMARKWRERSRRTRGESKETCHRSEQNTP